MSKTQWTWTIVLGTVVAIGRGESQVPQSPPRLSLADAVVRAAGEAPSVLLARERTTEAEARVRQTRSPLLPTLSGSASWLDRSFNRNSLGLDIPVPPGQPAPPDLVGPFGTVDARLQVTQAIFDYASIARVKASRSQLAGAQAGNAVAAERSAFVAAAAYLRAARADARVTARRADSALAADLVTLAQAQLDAGVTAAIDVTRARTQLAASAGAVVVARTESARGLIDLTRALGLDARTPLALADSLSDAMVRTDVPTDPDSAVARALVGRPDLQAEIARGVAARQGASAITAERLPRLELAADYGVSGPSASDVIGTGQVGVQVTLPILDGFRRDARLAEQRAVAREAAIGEADLRRQIGAEVQTALLELRSAAAQRDIATERLRLAQAELDQARERFAAGVAGNIEVIAAQVSLINARDGEIDARFTAAAARAALARAVGVARGIR